MIETDKFPEAFERFEEVVDTRRIHSFTQLLMSFKMWSGEKWVGSPKQIEALKREARKQGIRVYMWSFRTGRTGRIIVPEILRAPPKTWKHERIAVRGRLQSRYRDLRTGRFIKKPF